MSVILKRRLTYVTIALFNFFCGVEYAVIFPSLWGYISTRFNAPSSMMGLIIAAFSVSGLFSNPLVGKWADVYQNTKVILIITNFGEIIGSFMYFMGLSSWFLVASRLVSGIGIGGGAAMLADITRSTPEEDRTGIISIVMSTRQVGLLVGPAVNLLFSSLNYDIGPFHLDKHSAPGLFMTIVWIVLELFFIFMYFNLTSLRGVEHIEEQLTYGYRTASRTEPTTPSDFLTPNTFLWTDTPAYERSTVDEPDSSKPHSSAPPPRQIYTEECGGETNLMIESAEQYIIKSSEGPCPNTSDDAGRNSWTLNSLRKKRISRSSSQANLLMDVSGFFSNFSKEYIRDDVVVLLALVFTSVMAQTSFETIITPLTKEFFNYNETQNSFFYLIAGFFSILVFGLIHLMSKKMSDRIILLIGQFFLIAAMCWFLIFIPRAKAGDKNSLIYMIVGTFLDIMGIPMLVVCSASLLSKMTSYDKQAMTHGLRRSWMSIGCIIGPLWGGAFLKFRYLLFAVPMGISMLILILYFASFKDLHPRKREISVSEAPTRPVSELTEDPIISVPDQQVLVET